jgi:short-subunit dehydrogenase
VETRTLACDVASPAFAAELARSTADLEVGVAVFNAAFSPIGPFVERSAEDLLRVVDVNVRAPLLFSRILTPQMVARSRGALVLMSSLAGLFGAPSVAAYAASKAFNTVLGESLWAELSPQGLDVLVSCAGAIRTSGYARFSAKEAPGTLDAAEVARETLVALGRGPVVVPGTVNKLASLLLGRLLTRKSAVSVMAASTRALGS